jgi:hypothetical protein
METRQVYNSDRNWIEEKDVKGQEKMETQTGIQ